ncbi:MAG TPA: hypothetical protein VNI20_00565 [Fimbriimonadaceae bacterium]|nr:hypothetical protein [Fimbriimonadaceae bacterium]
MQDGTQGTDERLEKKAPRKADMDSRFLAGCLTIALFSIGFYILAIWPFFEFPAHLRSGLLSVGLFGALPTLLVGVAAVRKFGLEGATALVGGSLAAAVFAYLRMDSMMLGKYDTNGQLPAPDYPDSWAWIVPLGWCLTVVAIVLFSLPKRELRDEGSNPTDR